jgi:hypothetical protein
MRTEGNLSPVHPLYQKKERERKEGNSSGLKGNLHQKEIQIYREEGRTLKTVNTYIVIKENTLLFSLLKR